MKSQTMGETAWSYESEKIERLPTGVYSIGVGRDLVELCQLPPEYIVSGLDAIFDQLTDGGANYGYCEQVKCYFRRRGKAIDIGTRKDFADLGWDRICDYFDTVEAMNGGAK